MSCCSSRDLYCTNDYNGFIVLKPDKFTVKGVYFSGYEANGVETANGFIFSAGKDGVFGGVVKNDEFNAIFNVSIGDWFPDVDVSECNIAMIKALPIAMDKVYICVIAYSGYDLYFYSKIVNVFTIFNNSTIELNKQEEIKPIAEYQANSDNEEVIDVTSSIDNNFNVDEARTVIMEKIKDDLEDIFNTNLPSFIELKTIFSLGSNGSIDGILYMLDVDCLTIKKRKIFTDLDINVGDNIETVKTLEKPIFVPNKYAFTNFATYGLRNGACSQIYSVVKNSNKNSFLYLFTTDEITFFGYSDESTLVYCNTQSKAMFFKCDADKVDEFNIANNIIINPKDGVYAKTLNAPITLPSGTLKQQDEDITFISCFDIYFNYK